MTEIEKKALALVNEVERDFGDNSPTIRIIREDLMDEALCRAIEQHEAYKQDVSDAVEDTKFMVETHCDTEALALVSNRLNRFIIAKPDPLVEVIEECDDGTYGETKAEYAAKLREALAKRGLKIVEIER